MSRKERIDLGIIPDPDALRPDQELALTEVMQRPAGDYVRDRTPDASPRAQLAAALDFEAGVMHCVEMLEKQQYRYLGIQLRTRVLGEVHENAGQRALREAGYADGSGKRL